MLFPRTITAFLFLTAFIINSEANGGIQMRNGQLLHGEFSHVGVAGLGVLIMPRGEFAITRCAYKGSRGGVRISFVDGGWHKLEDFMEEVDLSLIHI